jgi:UDPglucose 6-dehydrogenase
MLIGIIGNGFVGKATFQLKCKDIEILVYDSKPHLCYPLELKLNDLLKCDLIFVCVPTPMTKDGSCYTKIVENVLNDLKIIQYKGFIIVRSTVPIGTCDKLDCYFMPEFLTEQNWHFDFINNKEWIFGLTGDTNKDEEFITTIKKLFNFAFLNKNILYNDLYFVTNAEAEMIKLFRNCFLATKVSFCNEIYQYCKIKNINYENIINLACKDSRIGFSHTNIPGPDGQCGFGGTCFPKDTSSLKSEMDKYNLNFSNIKPLILSAVIERNNTIDRIEKDWYNNKGRAVIDFDLI